MKFGISSLDNDIHFDLGLQTMQLRLGVVQSKWDLAGSVELLSP